MPADLGVLAASGEALPDKAAQALAALAECGLGSRDPALVGLIRVSLMHKSFLYENQAWLPGLSQKHLLILGKVGSAFQQRATAIDAYNRYGAAQHRSLSSETARVGPLSQKWSSELGWLRASVLLGNGYPEGHPLSPKMTIGLFQQLLGALCLADEVGAANGLLAGLLSRAHEDTHISDPKTLLQEILPFPVSYEVARMGPDHDSTFHAVVSEPTGRSGTGSGKNKKDACQAAALDLIQKHFADLVPATKPGASERPEPEPASEAEGHTQQIARLQEMFRLQPSARGLLSQALIHKSWIYENSKAAKEAGQQDNSALAFVGSFLLEYEYSLAAARAIIADDEPDLEGFLAQQNAAYVEAFRLTECAEGLLLGAGQSRTTGLTDSIAADSFQAIFAAISAGCGYPSSLMSCWPASWSAIWHLIAPGRPRSSSARERLAIAAQKMGLDVTYEIDEQGPDHDRFYRCTLVAGSNSTGKSISVKGTFDRSKSKAREIAAEQIMSALDSLGALAEAQIAPVNETTREVASFLSEHLAASDSSTQ